MADQNFDDDDDLDSLDRGDSFDQEDIEEEIEEEEVEDIEEESEEEEEELPKSSAKEPKIPKHRLDEVLSQRDEARERQLWLEEQLEKLIALQTKKDEEVVNKPVYDFANAEEKYISLIIEGETAQASKLRAEIDRERKAEMMSLIESVKTESETKVKQESNKAVETERFNSLVETFKSKYTFLDDDSDDYNEEAVDTINTLTAGYIASGRSKSDSLRLAVNKVVPMYNKEESSSKTVLGKQRTQDAVKKAASASNKQPPQSPSGKSTSKSVDLTKIDVTKMSDKDFNNLTEREKRILRGD